MSCQRTRQMVDGWLDGELDAGTNAALAQHAAQCPNCSALWRERWALRATVRTAPRYAASAALKSAVSAQAQVLQVPIEGAAAARVVATEAGRPRVARPLRTVSWLQALALAGASAACAVLLTLLAVQFPDGASAQARLREQVVARHVAALATRHLIDVASSDRHVVKPWLLGKIDFAPQVPDLSVQGFRLEGARLDQVDGRTAVALVYRLREHPVQLFVWRSAESSDADVALVTVRGFSVATWSAAGLHHAAVSDADAGEVARFARALRGT